MASFAAQLLDVFYDLVERVTGYSARPADDDEDAQKPGKLAFVEKFQTEEVVEIRSRNLPVSGGSGAQVNLDGM